MCSEDPLLELESVRNALKNGKDEYLWPPGLTVSEAVDWVAKEAFRLRSIVNCLATSEGIVGMRIEFPTKEQKVLIITGPSELEARMGKLLSDALLLRTERSKLAQETEP